MLDIPWYGWMQMELWECLTSFYSVFIHPTATNMYHHHMMTWLRPCGSDDHTIFLTLSATELHSSFIVILFLHHYFTTLQSLLISSHWSNRFCILIQPSFLPHFPVISFIINCSAGCFAGTFPDRGAGCDYLWLQLSNSLILTGVLWADGGDVQAPLTASARRWGI